MSGTFQLDSALFPRDPLTKRWMPDEVGRAGTREPIFTDIWRLEMDFGTLETQGEYDFFMTRFISGGLYLATLPHPTNAQLVNFTGVSIERFEATFSDVDQNYYAEGARLVLGVDIRATGSA